MVAFEGTQAGCKHPGAENVYRQVPRVEEYPINRAKSKAKIQGNSPSVTTQA